MVYVQGTLLCLDKNKGITIGQSSLLYMFRAQKIKKDYKNSVSI